MSGRCLSCNKTLSDFEMTRKYAESREYVGLCNRCLITVPDFPPVLERSDLFHEEMSEEEEDYGEISTT